MDLLKKPAVIIAGIFIIKLCTVCYLVDLAKCNSAKEFVGLASMSGDARSYITPVDNFINERKYYFESARAGRMPYVGLVYYPFRLLFSKKTALSIVVILQVFIGAIAVYFMAKLCEKLFVGRDAFWLYIFLSCVSLYVTVFDYYILSESLGISFACLFSYHYFIFLSAGRTSPRLLVAGTFLCLAILFKPYLTVLFVLIGLEFMHYGRCDLRTSAKMVLKNVLLISFPLLVFNAPWTIRNYFLMKKFVPFQQDVHAGYDLSPAYLALVDFIRTIGESTVYWDKRSAGCYFEPDGEWPCEYRFPERIFSPTLTMEQLEDAKSTYLKYKENHSDSLGNLSVMKFNTMTRVFKNEHKFFYYVINPMILCKHFLIHSGSYYLPIKRDSECYRPYQLILKLSQSLMYYLVLLAGFVGTVHLFRKNPKSFMIFAFPVYVVVIFPITFKMTEFRYFHPVYPFLMIGLVNVLLELRKLLSTASQRA